METARAVCECSALSPVLFHAPQANLAQKLTNTQAIHENIHCLVSSDLKKHTLVIVMSDSKDLYEYPYVEIFDVQVRHSCSKTD